MRSGDVVGNMLKSVFANITSATPKVQDAFKQLGISMTTVGANGQQQMKPVYDLLLELASASQNASVSSNKYFEVISGGKYQFDTMKAALSSLTTIQDAYNISVNSSGEAAKLSQAQLHTLQAELQRLRDTIQQMSYNAESNGLGAVFKSLVVGVTDLINGIERLPASVDWTVAGFVGLLLAGKTLTSMMSTLRTTFDAVGASIQFISSPVKSLQAAWGELTTASNSTTIALARKTAATEADATANTAQAATSGAVVAGLEAEGVAATTAAAGFSALDVASAGITVVLGLAVTALAGTATYLGATQQKANDAAQSVQNLNQTFTENSMQAQSNLSQLIQNINSLQDLKSAYDKAKQAMDTATEGTTTYQNAESQMQDIERQLIGLVGDKAAQQILSSNNIVGAINTEIQAKIDAQIKDNQLTVQNMQNEKDKTQTVIDQTNARITAYLNEAQAQQALANSAKQQAQNESGKFSGIDFYNAGQHQNAAKGNLDAAAKAQAANQQNQQTLDNIQKNIDAEQATIDQLNKMKDELTKAPDLKFNGTPDPYGGGGLNSDFTPSTTKPKKPKAPSASSVTEPYKDLASEDKSALDPFNQAIDQTNAKLAMLNAQTSAFNTNNHNTITSESQLDEVRQRANDTITQLTNHQDELHAANEQIRQMLPNIEAQMANVDQQYANGSITAAEHTSAINTLRSEYDNLTKSMNSNSVAWYKDQEEMTKQADAVQQATEKLLAYNDAQAKNKYDNTIKNDNNALADTTHTIQNYSNEMSKAGAELTKHNDNVQAGKDYLDAYNNSQAELTKKINELNTENQDYSNRQTQITQEMADWKSKLDSGQITIDQYNSHIQSLHQEYDSLTGSINTNKDAIVSSKDTMVNNTQAVHDKIVEILKASYAEQQKIEEQHLKDQYDATIAPLKEQEVNLQNTIKLLQAQYKVQDDLYRLSTMQNDLQNEMSLQNHEYIDANGKISYTYDKSQVAQQQRQIAEEKLRQQRDNEQQSLDLQRQSLQDQIQQETDTYNQQKDNLTAYWTWKMSQDNLNSEADNLIQKNGLDGSLKLVQDYSKNVQDEFQKIQNAAIAAGQAISAAMQAQSNIHMPNVSGGSSGNQGTIAPGGDTGGGTQPPAFGNNSPGAGGAANGTGNGNPTSNSSGSTGLNNSQLENILSQAGQQWNQYANDPHKQDEIHQGIYGTLTSAGASYDDHTGIWTASDGTILNGANAGQKLPSYAKGGWIGQDQIAQLHGNEEVIGQSLTASIMSKFGVKPSEILAKLANFVPNRASISGFNPSSASIANNNASSIVIHGNLEFPNVRTADDAKGFTSTLFQRAYYAAGAGARS